MLGVGELLPLAPARRGTAPAPPLDVARTLDDVLAARRSTSSTCTSRSRRARRRSRCATRARSTSGPSTRRPSASISTQVARRFVERFFGRLDARTASFDATRELMERAFPATYEVLRPGADTVAGAQRGRRPAADRVRRPRGPPGAAAVPARAAPPAGGARVARHRLHAGRARAERAAQPRARPRRGRHRRGATEAEVLAAADVWSSPRRSARRRRRACSCARSGAGAVPLAARLPAVRGDPARRRPRAAVRARRRRDADRAARAAADRRPRCASRPRGRGRRRAPELSWSVVAERFEALYAEVAARRHPPRATARCARGSPPAR